MITESRKLIRKIEEEINEFKKEIKSVKQTPQTNYK